MQLDDVLTELVADSGDRLLRVAYQLTHDRMAAQDLVQDALLRVYRSVRRRGLAPEDWYAYLRRAVVNEYIRTRRLRSSTEIVTDTLPERPTAVSPEDRAADQEQLWAALGELSERQRAVLVLRYYEGLADHEIAALLSCREASVRSLARRRRGGWYVPFAVAVAVAAVVLGSVSVGRLLAGHQQKTVLFSRGTAHATSPGPAPATSRGTAAAVRLTCPAKYAKQAPWVPAQPSGVDGRARLVPQQTPRSVLICGYDGSNGARQQAGWALSGRRSVTGNLAGLARQLSWQPRQVPGHEVICIGTGGPQTNYLVGVTYPGGAMIWVAVTDDAHECVAASNGQFTSDSLIGHQVSKAFTSGRWPARPPASCQGADGRLGQDTAMVPAGVSSLTICTLKAHHALTADRTLTSGYQVLVQALDRLPTRLSIHACSGSPGPGSYYVLVFSYPQGPPVSVGVTVGCHPAIDNDSVQADSADGIRPIIQQLLKAK